jgi:hypothetical protein
MINSYFGRCESCLLIGSELKQLYLRRRHNDVLHSSLLEKLKYYVHISHSPTSPKKIHSQIYLLAERKKEMSDRVKTVAQSEIQRLSSLTLRALKSGAYLYPFQVPPPSTF